MRFFLALPLPPELTKLVNDIGARWNQSAGSAPHITILLPHDLATDATEEELINSLRLAASTITCFSVDYGGVGSFDNKRIIYLGIKSDETFVACHQALYSAAKPYLVPVQSPFLHVPAPHITITTHYCKEREGAWDELKSLPNTGSFACQEVIVLVEKGEKRCWEEAAMLPFKPK